MNSTRPTPPWVPVDYFAQTFLEKTVIVRFGFTDAPPAGVLNVEEARQNLYTVPSTIWSTEPQ